MLFLGSPPGPRLLWGWEWGSRGRWDSPGTEGTSLENKKREVENFHPRAHMYLLSDYFSLASVEHFLLCLIGNRGAFPLPAPFPHLPGAVTCMYQVLEAEVVFLEGKYWMLWFHGLESRNQPMLPSSVEATPISLISPVTQWTSMLNLLLQFCPPPPRPICPFLKITDHSLLFSKGKTMIKPECYSLSELFWNLKHTQKRAHSQNVQLGAFSPSRHVHVASSQRRTQPVLPSAPLRPWPDPQLKGGPLPISNSRGWCHWVWTLAIEPFSESSFGAGFFQRDVSETRLCCCSEVVLHHCSIATYCACKHFYQVFIFNTRS